MGWHIKCPAVIPGAWKVLRNVGWMYMSGVHVYYHHESKCKDNIPLSTDETKLYIAVFVFGFLKSNVNI